MPDEEFRPGAHDPVEFKRKYPGWVSFPATFVPHPRPIPKWKIINGQRWPLDKRGRPWPKTRYGRPTCPFDELPPGVRAPGTQVELMRRLENPMLLCGDEGMSTRCWPRGCEPSRRRLPHLRRRCNGPRPMTATGSARCGTTWMRWRGWTGSCASSPPRPDGNGWRGSNADAIRAGMDQARADGTGGVQVAQLALPAAVPPSPGMADAAPPAIGQVQLDRAGRRLGYVADEIARGGLSDAAAHLLLGKPYPPEVDDPSLGTLAPLPGFTPSALPDGVEPGFDTDPDAGRPAVLVTPAAPQAGPDIEGFNQFDGDPATVFERSELRSNMEEAGKIEKEDSRVAHHIVPGGGPMSGQRDAGRSQKLLEELKIDLNDADNGVALSPGFHAKIHTKKY